MKIFACILLFAFMTLFNSVESGVSLSTVRNHSAYQRLLNDEDNQIEWANGRPIARIINGVRMLFVRAPKPDQGPVNLENNDALFRDGKRKAIYHGGQFHELLRDGGIAPVSPLNGDVMTRRGKPRAVYDNDSWRSHRYALIRAN